MCLWKSNHVVIHFGGTCVETAHEGEIIQLKNSEIQLYCICLRVQERCFKQVYGSTYCTAVWPKHLCDKNTAKRWRVRGIESFTSSRTEIFYHLFIRTSFIPLVEWDETQTSIFLCLSTMKVLLARLPWSLREGSTMSIWFSNTFRDQKYFKRDFNLSWNVSPCPLPHQSSSLQYQCTVSSHRQSCSLS